MSPWITVLKVYVSCDKCKKKVIGIVSNFEGVNKIEVVPEKDTLTVIGEADPSAIVTRLRKKGKRADIVSVGPFPPPKTPTTTPPPTKPPPPPPPPPPQPCPCPCPCSCRGGIGVCEPVALMTLDYQDPPPPCSIM